METIKNMFPSLPKSRKGNLFPSLPKRSKKQSSFPSFNRMKKMGESFKFLDGWNKKNIYEISINSSKISEKVIHFPITIVLNSINVGAFFTELNSSIPPSKVSLLIHSDNVNDSTSFVDSSTHKHTITANGNVKHKTAQYKFGASSIYFDGNTDWLEIADNSDFELGNSDFTIDTWVYLIAYPSNNAGAYQSTITSKDKSTGRSFIFILGGTASSFTTINFIGFSNNTTYETISENYSFNLNTWYHVAVIRKGNLIYLFVNGTLLNTGGTSFTTTIQDTTTTLKIGTSNYDTTYKYELAGYIDEFSFIKGEGKWTSSFSVPTGPYYKNLWKKIAIADENANELYIEKEQYNSTTSKACFHCSKSNFIINSGKNTKLYLYYDKNHSDNDSYVGEANSTPAKNVWDSNFKLVYNMAQDPSRGSNCIKDSTSNANHGTPSGSMTNTDLIDGKTGKAIEFDGVDDEITFSSISLTDWTMEILCKNQNGGTAHDGYVIIDGAGIVAENGVVYALIQANDARVKSSNIIKTAIYEYVVANRTGTNYNLFINGTEDSNSVTDTGWGLTGVYKIGFGRSSAYTEMTMDCIRISSIVRSAAWIKATNASFNNTLLTIKKK